MKIILSFHTLSSEKWAVPRVSIIVVLNLVIYYHAIILPGLEYLVKSRSRRIDI